MTLTSQLITGNTRVLQKLLKYFNGKILQKLLKYFNGKTVSTSFVLPSAGVLPVIFILDLIDSESVKVACGLSLLCCQKLPDVF